jgi:hypothetical protein
MTYTAVNPHACCNGDGPEDAHTAARPPSHPHASPHLTNSDGLRWKTDSRPPANGPPTATPQQRRHSPSTPARGPPRPPTPRPSPQPPPPPSQRQGQVPITEQNFFDSIDFTWAQPSPNRSEPEDLIHDFMTLTGIKVGQIRADEAGEFARSATFQAYCKRHNIVIEEVPAYTHTFNARAEGAIRICKDKVRAFLRRANMPRRFWPDASLHWGRTYAHWPDASGHTAWEKLDELGPHSLCHDLERDRHVFGSYVTGHLPREHPQVADITHDDRAEEGVFLGNDLTTPTFWLWSFKHKKTMRMSDPKHFDHILPFLQPADVHHTIPLTAQEVVRMHAKDDVPVAVGASDLQTDRISRSGEPSLSPAAISSSPQQSRATTGICNPGENGQSLHDILFAYLSQTPEGIKLRQQGEKQQALEHARERLERAVKGLKDNKASENEVVRQIYKQITPTFDLRDDGIW